MCKDIMEMDKLDRPREKLMRYGPGRLSDAELLAVLLRTGTKERGVLDLAGDILRDFKQETIADAGAPLTIRWSPKSFIDLPVGR